MTECSKEQGDEGMKVMLKKLTAVFALLCLVLTSGCQHGGKEVVNNDRKDDILIGMSFDSFIIERWQRDRDVFVSTANDLGAVVNVQNAHGDLDEQIAQIDYFIQKKVDAIVVVAIDCYGLSDAVKRAKDAGIYVISYDRLVMNGDVDLYISFDNEMVGQMMAESLVESLPKGSNVISICGPKADQNVAQVGKGFDAVINNSTLNVVKQEYAEGWLAEAAYDFVNREINAGTVFSGVHCGNDNLATQAVKALSERRMAGTVCVVGQDAELAACQRIVEGTQTMTVYKPVEKLAKQAAEDTIKIIKGESLNATDTIFDGTSEVPYVKLSPIKVTKSNMDQVIIDGGFHRREEVYLNIS